MIKIIVQNDIFSKIVYYNELMLELDQSIRINFWELTICCLLQDEFNADEKNEDNSFIYGIHDSIDRSNWL